MPATIFSGSYVKTLKAQLKLKDTARILTGTANPTLVATDAERGSIYLRDGTTVGEVYIKQDNGSTTNWDLVLTTDFYNNVLVNQNGDILTNQFGQILVTG